MTAAWLSAAVTALMALGAALGVIWRSGKRDGKLDALLEQLTRITDDHEWRLRQLERARERYMVSNQAPEWPQQQPRPRPDHRRRNPPWT
jgi:hypothetical protein